jgi:hypothetical protein
LIKSRTPKEDFLSKGFSSSVEDAKKNLNMSLEKDIDNQKLEIVSKTSSIDTQ